MISAPDHDDDGISYDPSNPGNGDDVSDDADLSVDVPNTNANDELTSGNITYGSTDTTKGDNDLLLEDDANDENIMSNEDTPLLSTHRTPKNATPAVPVPVPEPLPEPFVLERSRINALASLTFHWFVPLLTIGNSKDQLDPEDIQTLPLPPSCTTSNVSKKFEDEWKDEMDRYNQQQMNSKRMDTETGTGTGSKYSPSVARCLAKAFGKEFINAGLLKLIHDINVFVGPIVLHGLIQFLRDPNKPLRTGLLLTLSVTVSQTIMSFCLRHYFFKCYLVGLRMRTAIVVMVYKKALVLSSEERERRKTGEIVNLMTVDAQRIQDLTTYLHAIWYSFLQISLSIYFLW